MAGASWQEAFRQSVDQQEVTSHQQQVISQPQMENITLVKTPFQEDSIQGFALAATRVAVSLEEVGRQRELVGRRERLGGAK